MASLTGNADLFTLSSTNNSYYYSVNKALLTLRKMTDDMSATSFASTYLVTVDANARFLMMNTGIHFGSSRLIAPANWEMLNVLMIHLCPITLFLKVTDMRAGDFALLHLGS